MARASYKVGDIFEVPLQHGLKGYIQYIDKDTTELNSDVIRIFKSRYPADVNPDMEDIVVGDIEFYSHVTGVEFGVKDGSWKKVGTSSNIGDQKAPFFRSPGDRPEKREDGLWYAWPQISKKWYIWRMNEEHCLVQELTGENINAYPGEVTWPKFIVYQMQTGKHYGAYPAYK